jgi:S-adenosylmethionine decarboxylase
MTHGHEGDASGTGREWLVEAFGCDAERLTRVDALQRLFEVAVQELALHPVGDAVWHQFPAPGGITGLWLLAESHLTVHTFPEFKSACINLFCCTPRRSWEWDVRLAALLGATDVRVRSVTRAYGASGVDASVTGTSIDDRSLVGGSRGTTSEGRT